MGDRGSHYLQREHLPLNLKKIKCDKDLQYPNNIDKGMPYDVFKLIPF